MQPRTSPDKFAVSLGLASPDLESLLSQVEVTNALPVNKDAESLRKRKDFFAKIDRKKKGAVTLADVKWGVDKVLDLRDYLNDDVVKHAYHAASTIGELGSTQ